MKLRILIVEDELSLNTTLYDFLTLKKHDVYSADSLKEARAKIESFEFDVILLDVGLPDGNGLELGEEIKNSTAAILLYMSAYNDPEIKLKALTIGAEDYITKPFDLRELALRLERILERKSSFGQKQIGNLKICFNQYQVTDAKGEVIALSSKEMGILKLLLNNSNKVITRDYIITQIWGENAYPSNRTVDNYIVKLRKWTETDPSPKLEIISVRSVGYKLEIKGSLNE